MKFALTFLKRTSIIWRLSSLSGTCSCLKVPTIVICNLATETWKSSTLWSPTKSFGQIWISSQGRSWSDKYWYGWRAPSFSSLQCYSRTILRRPIRSWVSISRTLSVPATTPKKTHQNQITKSWHSRISRSRTANRIVSWAVIVKDTHRYCSRGHFSRQSSCIKLKRIRSCQRPATTASNCRCCGFCSTW